MNWKFWEKRSTPSVSLDDTAGMMRLLRIPGGGTVTEQGALAISTVYSCIRVIAEGVASLPWHTYRKISDGQEVYSEHPTYHLLHAEPNSLMTSFMFREMMLLHVLTYGNFYAYILRDRMNRPVELLPLNPWEVSVTLWEGKLYYQTKYGVIPAYDMIHVAGLAWDGITGKSPIRLQAQQLGITLNSQQYGADFFENGATLGGILTNKSGTVYTDPQREQLKKAWYEDTHGIRNNHRTKILGGGLEYQRIGVPPEEAQFLETRKLGSIEICSMYRVPPHMVAILDRATFSNIEHQDIGFVKYTLMPWLVRIKQEFDRKIYREQEKGAIYNDFNVNGLLRGDITSQTTHIQQMMDRGVYSINDALRFLGQNSIGKGGERRLVQRNMVPLDRVDDVLTLEQSKKSGKGKKDN